MRQLIIVSLFVLAGCSSSARYAVAAASWEAVEVADDVARDQYRAACPTATQPGSPERAACIRALTRLDEALRVGDRYVGLHEAIEAARGTAAAAVMALWSADEANEEGQSRELRERLSCLAAAIQLLVRGFEGLQVPLPVAVENVIGLVAQYGGVARTVTLGECQGWDGSGRRAGETGETPAPTPERDGGVQ